MIGNIAIVHTDFRLYWPARLRALNAFLTKRGVRLSVVEVSGKGSPYSFADSSGSQAGLSWTQLFGDRRMEDIEPAEALGAVIAKLDELDPDAVISGPIAFPSGAASTRWCSGKRRPQVVFDDARLDDVPRPGYVDWIKRQVYSQIDAMVIPAPSHDATYRYFGFGSDRLFYGVNAVDNRFFTTPDVSVASPLPEAVMRGPFLLCVGRQIPKKNWLRLLEAFNNIAARPEAIDWSLVFIGDGPDHEELVRLAGGLAGSRIHFLPFSTQAELTHCYRTAAALILPSLHGETWGLVVNEAMAAGLPVLVSSSCGSAEVLVSEGVNGFVYDPERIGDIERALQAFIRLSPAEREMMGEASHRIIAGWGLERFCLGMWDALCFAQVQNKRRGTPAGRLIVNFWNGRYCPT
jgi:glycosyltransferase involved in cell wall biosynthesis